MIIQFQFFFQIIKIFFFSKSLYALQFYVFLALIYIYFHLFFKNQFFLILFLFLETKFKQMEKTKIIRKSKYYKKKQKVHEIVHENKDFFCPICLDFICGSVSIKCGHTFCEQCYIEYELLFDQCLICKQNLRNQEYRQCFLLDNIILEYIEKHQKDALEIYQNRKYEYLKWKQNRKVNKFEIGQKIDVRDEWNHIWCSAIISKIKKNQNQDLPSNIIVYYLHNSVQENIPVDSKRLAPQGFYTDRKDIPHYDNYKIKNSIIVKELCIGSPLICLSGVVAIQFGVFSHVVNLFKQKQNLQNLPIYQMAISGGICGLVSCSVLAPMEHIRIRLQVIKEGKSTSAINAFKHIYMQYGLKGIYKGLFITILRETPAMFIYFGVYNWMIRYFQAKYEKSSIVYQLAPLFSGALAGIGYWSIIYPVDTVKSKIQTDSFIGGKYKGSLDCFQKTIKTQGIKQLFRGFGVTNLRAVPVNAGSFFVYESVKIQIEKQIRL
ncbi:mitochondrial carrier protein, putative [Ichthyophthirius multifiliis]|uniref:Mitochondrial carrier protein, putative n=1 Tax=Ichthyophthirius multifiliis TaxID=5932 RepID=G0R180_ICHMU|nr:mitochondrial carrier protein, putative [Ichthyophthirius multifiliis]EGR28765.1 mitochondrial carrier protein, putative [Ichthyophthirius multifiliis]|eukprot:XP_004030001.1 mitochondrial carrier protein, putative [Ichthyophthirius multifiliis]